jgi:TPR repeat protein
VLVGWSSVNSIALADQQTPTDKPSQAAKSEPPSLDDPDFLVLESSFYTKGVENEVPTDMYRLAILYHTGISGDIVDKAKARELFQKAADKPFTPAIHALGVIYRDGDGVDQDPTKAFEYFLKASQDGYARSQFALAACYETGFGAEVNETEALKWYQKSADQNYLKAMLRLARAYNSGLLGLSQSQEKAYEYITKMEAILNGQSHILSSSDKDKQGAPVRDTNKPPFNLFQ